MTSANPDPIISYYFISGPIIPLKTFCFILSFLLFHLFYLHNLDYYFLLFQNLDLDYYFSYFNSIISIIFIETYYDCYCYYFTIILIIFIEKYYITFCYLYSII